MKIVIKSTNLSLTPSIKNYVEEKIGGLQKTIKNVLEAHVELAVENQHHRHGEVFRAEVTLYVPKDILRADESASEMYEAIDLVVPKLKQLIDKYKGKMKLRDKGLIRELKEMVLPFRIPPEAPPTAPSRIVRRKQFSLTSPITEEEAIYRMNLIDHDFYLFNNAATGRFSVVYKRYDGSYGLIEPGE